MPLFAVPEERSDGGYAVSSYRAVAPHLGTIDDLRDLAAELREHGISLVLDFIFNHTHPTTSGPVARSRAIRGTRTT